MIYFHGGGWVPGGLDSHDNVCRFLAHKTDSIIISVDYRLAPEAVFPAAADDAYAALEWVYRYADTLKADPSKIIVAGDSAGGNLAAAVALMSRDKKGPKVSAQVLIYPATNPSAMDTQSYQQFAKGYFLTKFYMEHFRALYLPDGKTWENVYASPLLADSFKDLPPAVVITAGFDPLKDDGRLYAKKLEKAGVLVSYICFDQMMHGFVSMDRFFDEAEQAVDTIATRLKLFISTQGKSDGVLPPWAN